MELNKKTAIAHFEIPELLAKDLSRRLQRQQIYQNMLPTLIDQPDRFGVIEDRLIDLMNKIDHCKHEITEKHVPVEYRSANFVWNYEGYAISGCTVDIYPA